MFSTKTTSLGSSMLICLWSSRSGSASALPHLAVGVLAAHVALRGGPQRGRDLPEDGVEVLRARVPLRLQRLVVGRRLTGPARHQRGDIALQVAELLLDLTRDRVRVPRGRVARLR